MQTQEDRTLRIEAKAISDEVAAVNLRAGGEAAVEINATEVIEPTLAELNALANAQALSSLNTIQHGDSEQLPEVVEEEPEYRPGHVEVASHLSVYVASMRKTLLAADN